MSSAVVYYSGPFTSAIASTQTAHDGAESITITYTFGQRPSVSSFTIDSSGAGCTNADPTASVTANPLIYTATLVTNAAGTCTVALSAGALTQFGGDATLLNAAATSVVINYVASPSVTIAVYTESTNTLRTVHAGTNETVDVTYTFSPSWTMTVSSFTVQAAGGCVPLGAAEVQGNEATVQVGDTRGVCVCG